MEARTRNKYLILPISLLMLNAVEMVVGYKAQLIENPHVRTLAVLGFYSIGVALIAYVTTPAVQTVLRKAHATSKKGGGFLGEIALVVFLGAVLYGLYFVLYTRGPEGLLPDSLHNDLSMDRLLEGVPYGW